MLGSHRYQAIRSGPRLIVTGAVHGDETCGTEAIRRILAELEQGQLTLLCGQLTLVPVCNPLAYQQGSRQAERNLNRCLMPDPAPRTYEDHLANQLCPLLAAHDVLLDLHSFRGAGQPFVLVGPENNDGPVEPFQHAAAELALARALGVGRLVHGWLSTYAEAALCRRRQSADDNTARAAALADTRFGIGTTEYMRSAGGYAVTLECGQHQAPGAPQLAYTAIHNTLRLLGMTAGAPVLPQAMEALHIYDVIDRRHDADRFVCEWRSFDPIAAGQLIGLRADGEEIRAAFDGRVIFPDAAAAVGSEWIYLCKPSERLRKEIG